VKIKKNNYKLLAIVIIIFFLLSIVLLPKYFISKEGQKCLINYHCSFLNCDEKNSKLDKNDLVFYEPMCIDGQCQCEWYGKFLHFK